MNVLIDTTERTILRGCISAGFASPVDEELADILRLEDYLIRDKSASFLLEMQGDSMQEYGICDGDLIILERGASIATGDLVVWLDQDGYHMNFFTQENSHLLADIPIIGVVVSVVRKYK